MLARKLPFKTNAYVFAALFGREHGERRTATRQRAFAGMEIEAVIMIVAADLRAVERTRPEVRIFVGALARECEILSTNIGEKDGAAAEIDFFHLSRGQLIELCDRNIGDAHQAAAFCSR